MDVYLWVRFPKKGTIYTNKRYPAATTIGKTDGDGEHKKRNHVGARHLIYRR